MSLRFFLSAVVVCLVGFTIPYAVHIGTDRDSLMIQPMISDRVHSVIEGRPHKCEFRLENVSSEAIQLIGANTSCGCMKLSSEGGELAEFPVILNDGEQRLFSITVDTTGRRGLQSYALDLSYILDSERKTRNVRHLLQVDVSPPWYLSTGEIKAEVKEDTDFQLVVSVNKSVPDLEISRVTSTNAAAIRTEWRRITDGDVFSRAQDGFQPAFVITGVIKMRKSRELPLRDTIYIFPTDASFRALSVPVLHTSESELLQVAPDTLVFRRSQKEGVLERSVLISGAPHQTVNLEGHADGIQAEITPLNLGKWLCRLHVDLSKGPSDRQLIFTSSDGSTATLNLNFVGF